MRFNRILVVVVAAGACLAGLAPLPAARAAPLPVKVMTIPLDGFQAASSAPAPMPFTMLGVSWAGDARPVVNVRTSDDGHAWSPWTPLHGEAEDGPDHSSPEFTGRSAVGPLWTGPARFVDVAWAGGGGAPALHLVDTSGRSASTGDRLRSLLGGVLSPASRPARGLTTAPGVIARSDWGADETIRGNFVGHTRVVKVGFVHHTVSANSYSAAQAPDIVRGIYEYHVKALGWSDIGYNVLIDRYGKVYEGRWGGLERGVIGAHAAGFNSRSFGVALIGNFVSDSPPAAMLSSLTKVLAWKLDLHHIDPRGSSVLRSAGSGETVALRNISGHRDALATACPGAKLYEALPQIAAAVAVTGLPKIYGGHPEANPVRLRADETWPPVVFDAQFSTPTVWSLTVDSPEGVPLRTWSGAGTETIVSWTPAHAGAVLPPGHYPFRLEAGSAFRPVDDAVVLGASLLFDTWLLVGNPTTTTAVVDIGLSLPHGQVIPHSLTVPGQSRRTLYVNDVLPGTEVSAHLSATVPVVVERAMYFNHQRRIKGGSAVIGATSPRTEWFFAEGYTADGFEAYLTLQNPGPADTVAVVDYMFPGGETLRRTVGLKATSRTTVSINEHVGAGREVSTRVSAPAPIVVERPMYYLTDRWKGGDVVMGVDAPRTTWYFAEGYTGDGFDEYITVQNPSTTPVVYTLTFMDSSGQVNLLTRTMPGSARDTVDVKAAVGPGREVSVRLDATGPVVAERPMYFTFKGSVRDGHNSTGVAAPGTSFYFAEGYTGDDFDQYFTVLNPGLTSAQLVFTYLLGAGPPKTVTHTVAANSRYTVDVAVDVGRGREVSALVEASAPVVIERPMYFWYWGVWDGGHVASGVSEPSREWFFAEGYTG